MFLETSALTGENVEEGFLKCARSILNKIDSGEHGLFSTSSPSVRASQLPAVGCSDLGCVWQVSWTQRGWALGFSMETPHWGSYDSQEAPPHRINSSAVARDRLALIHKPPADRTPPTGKTLAWQHNLHRRTQHKWSSPLSLSPHISAPGVFWCAWSVFAAVSHTSDHLEEQSRSSPQPLYLSIRALEPSARSRWDQRRGKYQKRFLGSLTHMDDSRVVCTRCRAPVFLLRALFITLF